MKQLRGTELKRFNRSVKHDLKSDKEIIIVLFSVDYQANLGMIFRICDAVGAKKLYLTGGMREIGGNIFNKVSRHKEDVVNWEREEDIFKVVSGLKDEGFDVVGVEITDKSQRFDEYQWKKKTALVLGNEGHGVPDKVLNICHSAVYIPMVGGGGSLNVGVAAAIASYSVLLKKR
jgi:tRNA G18 (ribose-2'-O)-methylase SpoU